MGASTLIALGATALAAAAAMTTGHEAAVIGKAEAYIKDDLKDPFSARFIHVTVTNTGGTSLNVCGYYYARNGYGVYDGRTAFIVGIKDGRVVGDEYPGVYEYGGAGGLPYMVPIFNEAKSSTIAEHGGIEGGACSVLFSELEIEIYRAYNSAVASKRAELNAKYGGGF